MSSSPESIFFLLLFEVRERSKRILSSDFRAQIHVYVTNKNGSGGPCARCGAGGWSLPPPRPIVPSKVACFLRMFQLFYVSRVCGRGQCPRPRQVVGAVLIVMDGRGRILRTTIDPPIPTLPGRITSDFHRPGRQVVGGIFFGLLNYLTKADVSHAVCKS